MYYQPPCWNCLNQWRTRQAPRVPASCPTGYRRYTVVPGDTIYGIAQRFGVNVNALIAANPHIPNPGVLYVGDVLCVPGQDTGTCPPGTRPYTVQRGDTMIRIAQRFGVTLEALLQANPQIENPNILYLGDIVCVPSVIGPSLPCCIYLSVAELDARGSALFEPYGSLGQFSVSLIGVDLPPVTEFGNYNAYLAEIVVPTVQNYETVLSPVTDVPTLRAGRIIFSLPTGIVELPSETQVFVRPINTQSNAKGPVILRGSLSQCENR